MFFKLTECKVTALIVVGRNRILRKFDLSSSVSRLFQQKNITNYFKQFFSYYLTLKRSCVNLNKLDIYDSQNQNLNIF